MNNNQASTIETVDPTDEFPANEIIKRRVTMKIFVSCSYSLLQGDPDDSNRQRLDEDNHANMTPMGFKRKVRDAAARMGHAIHVSRGADLSRAVYEAAKALGLDIVEPAPEESQDEGEKPKAKKPAGKFAGATKGRRKGHALRPEEKDAIVKKMGGYFDFRLFGGVLTTLNLGEAGAMQVSFGVSVDPVVLIDSSITRVAVANEEESKKKDRTMGTLSVIQYALVPFEISISPWQARRTGLTWGDYHLFVEICKRMWDNSKSTTRGKVVVEKIVSFIHSSDLGDAQDARLCDAVQATLTNPGTAPRSTKDYTFSIDMTHVPESVRVIDVPV